MNSRFEALERAVGPVSRETFEELVSLESFFRRWATRINLVAPSTLETVWERHIIDSAQLASYARGGIRWVDLGSGGGFPALVVAVLLKRTSGFLIELVESNGKKAAYLQAAIAHFSLPARVHVQRIERIASVLAPPQIITARALAPLPLLFDLSVPLFSAETRGLFHKGRDYLREVEESAERWSFDLVEHPSVVERDSVILEISNLRRRQA